ncbi:hypothetical protein BU15DRAFT_73690 [Melanogaster broomeanus]|nr:hypothetical protein BU15DRAFT_73690 [Melanogaster broomeanus]
MTEIEHRQPEQAPPPAALTDLQSTVMEVQSSVGQVQEQTIVLRQDTDDIVAALENVRTVNETILHAVQELSPRVSTTSSLMEALGVPEVVAQLRTVLGLVHARPEDGSPAAPTSRTVPPPGSPAPSSTSAPDLAHYEPDLDLPSAPFHTVPMTFPAAHHPIMSHPPGTPGYMPRRALRREGAFYGPPEDVDWFRAGLVGGRGSQPPANRSAPSAPSWPQSPLQARLRPRRRSPSPNRIIQRQRQLASSLQTDEEGRIVPPEYFNNAESPESSQASQQTSSSDASGRKRAREDEDAGAAETGETPAAPGTPSIKRDAGNDSDGSAKRRKIESSATSGGSSKNRTKALSRSYSSVDVTRKSPRKDEA